MLRLPNARVSTPWTTFIQSYCHQKRNNQRIRKQPNRACFFFFKQWDPAVYPGSRVPSLIPWRGPFHVPLNAATERFDCTCRVPYITPLKQRHQDGDIANGSWRSNRRARTFALSKVVVFLFPLTFPHFWTYYLLSNSILADIFT